MATDISESRSSSSNDEIDLREVASALRRRWIWIASGGLLGLLLAGGPMLIPVKQSLKSIRMLVDTSQGPCAWTSRKFQIFDSPEFKNITCKGEFLSARQDLTSLAFDEFEPELSDESILVKVQPLTFGSKRNKNFASSTTQLELVVEKNTGNTVNFDNINSRLENLKSTFSTNRINNIKALSSDVIIGDEWISIEEVEPPETDAYKISFGLLASGLLGGLVLGSGAALVADQGSDRVFSNSRILEKLGYPLFVKLPMPPWTNQAESSLIGQLAARLDRSLDWRVLSIANEHKLVKPLANAINRLNEPGLNCKPVDPLLCSILRQESDVRSIGLLVVVESGFNSSQALQDASLLLSQLTYVKSIGIVWAGVPLPSELKAKNES